MHVQRRFDQGTFGAEAVLALNQRAVCARPVSRTHSFNPSRVNAMASSAESARGRHAWLARRSVGMA